ncbi:MAG: plasmid partitioning protein RepB [Rhodobacterales bacterium 17-64-5]|nr:MAG: plasmid partitioning protein RepB [Rhodobacterales bacterium 17-64-5]
MSRKDVLKGLLDPLPSPAVADIPRPAEMPRAQKGAIGAVSRSIADLKARSVVEMDPHLIDAGGMADRLESDAGEDDALAASIRIYGQQVPVLVRPHPVTEGRFQIVYGRRRVLALRDIGQPVKALIRDLDDRELVMAQGQENTARRDLSFIEKVNFARQMEEAGYDRKVICDAISVDKTLISRMLSIAAKVPREVIEAIGAAPSVGRDRWQAVADLVETADTDIDTMVAMLNLTARSARSDDRFQALLDYLTSSAEKTKAASRGPQKDPVTVRAEDGLPLGRATYDSRFLTLKLRLSQTEGFEAWLLDHLPALHRDWRGGQS